MSENKNVNWENEEEFDEITEEETINEQSVIFDPFLFEQVTTKFVKCVCKLEIKNSYGNGFFAYILSKELHFLITNYHVIDDNYLQKEKIIKLYIEIDHKQEEKIINLKSKRYIFTNKNLDVTIIEILDEDLIDDYFEIDENYIVNQAFQNKCVFNIQFPFGEKIKSSIGKVLRGNLQANRLIYDAGTQAGSSGSPIISVDNMKIIGIHKGTSKKLYNNMKVNKSIYLYNILKLLPEYITKSRNVIKCFYYIKNEGINNEIKIYDNKKQILKHIKSFSVFREDEKKKIPKDGMYRFPKEGKYYIIYNFKDSVNDLSEMFLNCDTLIKAYISSFPKNNITKINSIFNGCSSLKEINFTSSFITEKIKDMSNMFRNCSSLEKLDLTSFKTENVEDMSSMFIGCKALKEVNISKFNTEKVEDMSHMFEECRNLKRIDLSSFNTKNVEDFSCMFQFCESIETLDLSTFNISKVNTMKDMFRSCGHLMEINLTSFITNNCTLMKDLFLGCSSLISIKECKDEKIQKQFIKLKEELNDNEKNKLNTSEK